MKAYLSKQAQKENPERGNWGAWVQDIAFIIGLISTLPWMLFTAYAIRHGANIWSALALVTSMPVALVFFFAIVLSREPLMPKAKAERKQAYKELNTYLADNFNIQLTQEKTKELYLNNSTHLLKTETVQKILSIDTATNLPHIRTIGSESTETILPLTKPALNKEMETVLPVQLFK